MASFLYSAFIIGRVGERVNGETGDVGRGTEGGRQEAESEGQRRKGEEEKGTHRQATQGEGAMQALRI
jgi:hypothetical protein